MPSSPYTNYHYSTDRLVKKFKPALSNTFDVYINTSQINFKWTGKPVDWNEIHFMAYEAVLPGTSYELGQVYGDRQGRIEQYPTRRVYPPVDISFYIDKDYNTIRFFEAWINAISKNVGNTDNSYVYHEYSDQYETDVVIAKYERNFWSGGESNLTIDPSKNNPFPGNIVKYTLRNAYPTNLISIPVSYEGTNILRTTVTLNYDVYYFETKYGEENSIDQTGRSSGDQGDRATGLGPIQGGLEGEEIINAVNNNSRSVQSDINMIRSMQEASRLRQAGYSPGLGQSGKAGPGF